jgi:N-acetylneuraminate lyase
VGKISGDGKIQLGRFRLGGLIAAPYTPFDNEGALRLETIEQQARALVNAGVSGAFICGTTGEGLSMTTAERMEVAQRWASVCKGTTLKVIVHVGHNSQRDAIALAAQAAEIGASAIGALPPSFYKPATIDQLVDFLRPIASAGAGLPFYYYHLPSMTGVTLSMPDLLQVGGEHIPHLHGIKFTHGDLMEYQRCLKVGAEEYEIAWGVDEMLLGALAVGATSAVGSTYNYAAPLYLRMIGAFRRGDLDAARKCAAQSVDMVAVLLKHGVLRTGKATMAMLGLDCGPTRSPIPPLSGEELSTVRRSYERIGLFDWAAADRSVSVSIAPEIRSPSATQPM